jgi:adenylate kinase
MVLFFGPPGSGKSVQGELLVKRNGWHWLSTGQLFRDSSDTVILQRLATGELIDDALTSKVLSQALEGISDETHVVLDGYPRHTQQAEWLDQYLDEHNSKIECIILFEVPTDELTKRLAGRGRTEDSPEVIKRRIAIYHERTQPVIDFYRKSNVPVYSIDGQGGINVVHERVQAAVEACSLV